MLREWWYITEGDPVGPVTEAQLFELLRLKKIDQFTFVWREGLGDWKTISNIPELHENPATPPPAPISRHEQRSPLPQAENRPPQHSIEDSSGTDKWSSANGALARPSSTRNSAQEFFRRLGTTAKTALAIVLVLVAVSLAKPIGEFIGKTSTHQFASGYLKGTLAEATRQAAETLQGQLPKQLDPQTILFDVTPVGASMIYSHKLALTKESLLQSGTGLRDLRLRILNNVCNTKEMREMLELGVKYGYRYFDTNHEHIDLIWVTKESCSK